MRIQEVELINISQLDRYKHKTVKSEKNEIQGLIDNGKAKPLTKIKGYTIYTYAERFYALNNSTNLVDMTVDGFIKKVGNFYAFKINILSGRFGSSLKAYEFYRAILLNLPIIFVSDAQSYGGLKTWQKLEKSKDIEVFGWLNGKAVNVSTLDPDDTHISHDDVGADTSLSQILRMKLIAHKKIK